MNHTSEAWLERISSEEYAFQPYHTSRYKFASRYVAGKVVLDIACGVGYGTRVLANHHAKAVIGMDIEQSALQQSPAITLSTPKEPYFGIGSATSLPIADRSVEVVVSIETLEHITEAEQCLQEFSRVLAGGGLLILSTPNALVTKPRNGVPNNPFHVKEFEPPELEHLLRKYFSHVELLGQQVRGAPAVHQAETDRQSNPLHRLISLFPLRWRKSIPRMMPRQIADWLVLRITGHHVDLQEDDLEITSNRVEDAPVLVALCRK